MNVTRQNTEIFDQQHQMYAEGCCDEYPMYGELKSVLMAEGWVPYDVEVSFDHLQGFYRWTCKIIRN